MYAWDVYFNWCMRSFLLLMYEMSLTLIELDISYSDLMNVISYSGCRSKPVGVVSEVPQGSVLGSFFFLLYISEHFSILENKLMLMTPLW